MSGPALEARALTRRFGRLVAVDAVSFAVDRGSIFGLLGPNGSGKSTIIRMFCGLLAPTSGEAHVMGRPLAGAPRAQRRTIGYMSQRFSLYDDLTALENLGFFGRAYGLGGAALRRRRDAVIAITGLAGYEDARAANLSGGWKQRLALACALLHDPEILFLDEPTAGIDPVARRSLWNLLFELAAGGKTLFVTTHYMDEAERCDHLAYVYLSRLLLWGTPTELKALPSVTPAGRARWEVSAPSVTEAWRALAGARGVEEATIFGESVHLLAEDGVRPEDLLAALPEALRAATSVRPAAPSLEDVFVTMTRRAAAGAA